MKKKYALGVHHLNIAYCAGDIASYHRQVRESIIPILGILHRHPGWKFSIEICGASIEFIAKNYVHVLDEMRGLINRGQIELISATYAPQIWIAFPQIDLIKSIQINLDLLNKYSLKTSRIFFSQENFSGEGIKSLKKWFDIAVVKDDYYNYHYASEANPDEIQPYYQLEDIKLVVGWGHILETLASKLMNQPSPSQSLDRILLNRYPELLNDAYEKYTFSKFKDTKGAFEGIEWIWYHIGSSERFSKPHIRPENYVTCRYDPDWIAKIDQLLIDYELSGFEFIGIEDFIEKISTTHFSSNKCHHLIDGAWNMRASKGCYIWTSINSREHQDVLSVRNHNWLTRSRLIGVEALIEIFKPSLNNAEWLLGDLEKAWKHQMLAESSDATGWHPERSEISDSIYHSDMVLDIVGRMTSFFRAACGYRAMIIDTKSNKLHETLYNIRNELSALENEQLLLAKPLLVGGKGEFNYYNSMFNCQQIHVDFTPDEKKCGVYFEIEEGCISYSPALLDDEIYQLNLTDIIPETVYLPLPNGLLGIGNDLFIIKHNEYLNIAVSINKTSRTVCFEIENPKCNLTHWEFSIFKGDVKDAIALAISINIYPLVFL